MNRLTFKLSKIMLLLPALLCCPPATSAQEAAATPGATGWVEIAPTDEAFSVRMPRITFPVAEKHTSGALKVAGQRYGLRDDNAEYTVWSFKPESVPPGTRADKEAYLDLCAEIAWDLLVAPELNKATNNGSLKQSDTYRLAYHRALTSLSHPGRNYLLGVGRRQGAAQIYVTDARIYIVASLVEAAQLSKAETFMKSFSLNGKPAAAIEEQEESPGAVSAGGVGTGGAVNSSSNESNKVGDGGATNEAKETDHTRNFKASEVTRKAIIRSKPEPTYAEAARKFGVTGTVRVRAVLMSTGEVGAVTPLTRLPHGLTQKAIDAARGIQFDPASKNGRPVSQYVIIEYNFNIY